MFLESLLSKPGVSMTLLLVVKMTEKEDAILHQLHHWLTPVALMATPASPPQVIIIGSFLDKVKAKEGATAKLTKCLEISRQDLEDLPLSFWAFVSLIAVSPSLKVLINCVPSSRTSQFQSSAPPTHVTVLPGSCPRSGHPFQPKQSNYRTSLHGSKAMKTTYLKCCQPLRRCVKI